MTARRASAMRYRATLLCTALALLGTGASLAAERRNRGSTETAFVTQRVTYAGLDLAVQADAVALRQRIAASARAACEELAELVPLANLDTRACVRDAIRDAAKRADRVIAMAIVEHEFASAL
jgi:UrcA family protein